MTRGSSPLTTQDAQLDRVELAELLAEFEAYLDDPPRWSDRAMRSYRSLFGHFGVEGLLADDLIAEARRALSS